MSNVEPAYWITNGPLNPYGYNGPDDFLDINNQAVIA